MSQGLLANQKPNVYEDNQVLDDETKEKYTNELLFVNSKLTQNAITGPIKYNVIAEANNKYFALSDCATLVSTSNEKHGILAFSDDGINWDCFYHTLPSDLSCVAYGNGQYIVGVSKQYKAGSTSQIDENIFQYVSNDGKNFTNFYIEDSNKRKIGIQRIVFGNGVFVAQRDNSSYLYVSNSPSQPWQEIKSIDYYDSTKNLIFANGQFFWLCRNSNKNRWHLYKSNNGIDWELDNLLINTPNNYDVNIFGDETKAVITISTNVNSISSNKNTGYYFTNSSNQWNTLSGGLWGQSGFSSVNNGGFYNNECYLMLMSGEIYRSIDMMNWNLIKNLKMKAVGSTLVNLSSMVSYQYNFIFSPTRAGIFIAPKYSGSQMPVLIGRPFHPENPNDILNEIHFALTPNMH